MSIKKQIKRGTIQEVYQLHNGIFHPIQLFHTLSILHCHFPCVSYQTSLRNYGMRKRKIFCIYGCFTVSRYIKGGRKSHLQIQLNFQTYMYVHVCTIHIDNLMELKYFCANILQLFQIYIPRGSFLDVLTVMLSELYEKPRRNKDSVTEKSTQKNLCERHNCFDFTLFFLSAICCFLRLLPSPSQVIYLLNGHYKDT